MSMKEELIEKIQNKTLCMGVCGLGYVGLPLAVDKAKHGFAPSALMSSRKRWTW